ncbi:hypothetical protein [Actinokineospora enzanensis]|uniref:hypothetical protein n=1 Tax=Actinokineospora enzanensis TaxID=155975 RepID=UPI0003824D8B|nr:hypothetical protein [Actinokineospora enzanensis]
MTHDHSTDDTAETTDLLERARELVRARAAQLGTSVPGADDRKIVVLVDEASQFLGDAAATRDGTSMAELMRRHLHEMRDPRAAVYENCPVCGMTPRWYDGSQFGCSCCSATSSSFVGRLLPMSAEHLREAVELAVAHDREDVATALRASAQVFAGTLRLRFEPADSSRAEIQADAQVHVWQPGPGVYFVVVRSQAAAADCAETGWADENIAITHYDLTGPQPVRRVGAAVSAAAGVPESVADELEAFHRTLADATTAWVGGVRELRELDAPLLPAQRGWPKPRNPVS